MCIALGILCLARPIEGSQAADSQDAQAMGTITTAAGGPGRGAATRLAQQPTGLARFGNVLYVSDPEFDVVRAVDLRSGEESIVAGDGKPGFRGDGGRATTARLQDPRGLDVDQAGNLYIADSSNGRIRKVSPDGIIVTVAGNGGPNYDEEGKPARTTGLGRPMDVAVSPSGELYISETYRVGRVGSDGVLRTVAGSGTSIPDGVPRYGPYAEMAKGLALDSNGVLYIAATQLVLRLDPDGTLHTLAGREPFGSTNSGDGGPAAQAQIGAATDVALGADGSLYVTTGSGLRRISAGTITAVPGTAGDGPCVDQPTNPAVPAISAVTIDGTGATFVASATHGYVWQLNPGGRATIIAGNGEVIFDDALSDLAGATSGGDGGPAVDAQLAGVAGMTRDSAGNLYVAESLHRRVRRITPDGIITTVAGAGNNYCDSPGPADDPTPVALDAFIVPVDVAVDSLGRLYIADSWKNRVVRLRPDGRLETVAGGGYRQQDGGEAVGAQIVTINSVAIDGLGNLYIADAGMIYRVGPDGRIHRIAGSVGPWGSSGDGGPAIDALFQQRLPDLTVDLRGNLYVVDSQNNRVRRIDPAGTITTVAGTGGPIWEEQSFGGDGGPAVRAHLASPQGVAVDPVGNLYISDTANYRVRKVDVGGTITTIAGIGAGSVSPYHGGFEGDGGPATKALLSGPAGIVSTPAGTVFFFDGGNQRIRRIQGDPTITDPLIPLPALPVPDLGLPEIPIPSLPGGLALPAGYFMAGSDGSVYAFGAAAHRGSGTADTNDRSEYADIEPAPDRSGYWLVRGSGKVAAFGAALDLGSLPPGRLQPKEQVTSLSATPSGRGYWLFTNRGRAIPFGDAPVLGDVSTVKLNGPVLNSAPTPSGKGYYMVASDGGIFTFGDAAFLGSMGSTKLNAPVQSLVPDSDGTGYWLVASDGGIFAFDAPFKGSLGNVKLNKPVVGMVRYGDGYLMVGADGGIFTFSSSPFAGSLGDKAPAAPVVAVAALP
jgi:sugar lactone lactonase YvrE